MNLEAGKRYKLILKNSYRYEGIVTCVESGTIYFHDVKGEDHQFALDYIGSAVEVF